MLPFDESKQHAQVILDHIESRAFPESEDVASADLSPESWPEVALHIKEAREALKTEVRARSKAVAPDVDGWIKSAKQLQADIQSSKIEAHEIVQQGNHWKRLENDVFDSTQKLRLLEKELNFNHNLEASLQHLQTTHRQLDRIQRAILDDKLLEAIEALTSIEKDIQELHSSNDVRIFQACSSSIMHLRDEIAVVLQECWRQHVHVDKLSSSMTISGYKKSQTPLDLENTVVAMKQLGTFEDVLSSLSKVITHVLLMPRLEVQTDGSIRSITVKGDTIAGSERSKDLSAESLFTDITTVIDFFCQTLPSSIVEPFSADLVPSLLSPLISVWLMSAVPEDLGGMEDFKHTLSLVKDFGSRLDALQWPGKAELEEWVAAVPKTWLQKRQEVVLNNVRKLLARGIANTEAVERKETQMVSSKDGAFSAKPKDDDWNASWSDDDNEPAPQAQPAPSMERVSKRDEEDVSAWGFEEANEEDNAAPKASSSAEKASSSAEISSDEDRAADWGWGAEDDQSSPTANKASKHRTIDSPKVQRASDQQEITLMETFTITSLPKELAEILSSVISDYQQIQGASYAQSPMRKCRILLASLPALALALFRASSPLAYDAHPCGNMLLYNDCLWLAEHLNERFNTCLSEQALDDSMVDIKVLTSALQSHGKRSYAKEMDSQRTIITDLLDGAQGFANCTVHPFNQECDLAMDSTIKRIRHLHQEWNGVLSHSALVQAIGSLLSTVCSKMILDIEDLSDISEPQSQQLKRYFSQVGSLEDIFTPQSTDSPSPESGQNIPVTAAYVPTWFKFQYLGLILDSSLVDIMDLWIEQDLKLEFEAEELIDLVKALFEDGPRRRSAISEIRRSVR